ncbi:hypothetical protein [Alloprevotella tannerae]|nr:hypothetical protein [Alloprevotella tannerae]MBF0950374.1 hypothetical protein [Alloprevotella tannerae]
MSTLVADEGASPNGLLAANHRLPPPYHRLLPPNGGLPAANERRMRP